MTYLLIWLFGFVLGKLSSSEISFTVTYGGNKESEEKDEF